MSRDKQIEEMAMDIIKYNCKPCGCDDCACAFEFGTKEESCEEYLAYRKMAEALYNAGYRKASDVAREIFEGVDGITELFAKGIIGELEMYDMLADFKKKYEKKGE